MGAYENNLLEEGTREELAEALKKAWNLHLNGAGLLVNMAHMVERFNRQLIGIGIPDRPTILSRDRALARMDHMREELTEFAEALRDDDLQGAVDGLIDLVYVALGAIVEMGVTPMGVFEEVHTANMLKERGTVEKRPGSAGFDAIKPKGWEPPDLTPYLEATRSDVQWMREQREIADFHPGPAVVPALRLHTFPRILVIGHARHGKDTVCEMLRDNHGLKFTSSSMFCAENVVFPVLRGQYGYKTAEQCFDDRANHRTEWYRLIREYNTPDPSKLGRAIFAEHDVYCGLRHRAEFNALKNAGTFDVVVWVDGSTRHPAESPSSCSVEPWMADYELDNNGSLEDLKVGLSSLMDTILKKRLIR